MKFLSCITSCTLCTGRPATPTLDISSQLSLESIIALIAVYTTRPFVAISGPTDRYRYVCDQIQRLRRPLNRISLSAVARRRVLSCALYCSHVRFCPHANPPRSCTDAIDLTPTINRGPSCVNLTQHATGFPLLWSADVQ